MIINSTLVRVEFYSKIKNSTNSYEKSGDNAKILSYTYHQEVVMDAQKTGKLINFLRSKQGITQKELATLINVSDKAVSKWERGDGCPDVGILPLLAQTLETDVDSLLNGEITRREITQEEAEAMLKEMEAKDPANGLSNIDRQFVSAEAKIKFYDFKRPDYFGRNQLRDIWLCFTILCEKLKSDFAGIRKDLYSIQVCSVDQLNNDEFMQSVPQLSFFYSYDYNNNGFAIEVDPQLGKQLLRQDLKKYPEFLEYDVELLQIAYINSFSKRMQELLYENTNKSISLEEFEKPLTQKTLLPRSTNEPNGQMCMLVSLEIDTDNGKGYINIQLNYYYCINILSKYGFFNHDDLKLHQLTNIKAKHFDNNCFVEFGRFMPDTFAFEPGNIFVTDLNYNQPLNVLVGKDVKFKGQVVAVDENFGIRISEVLPENKIIHYDEEHYIALRLGGRYLSKDDEAKVQEGSVLELDVECGAALDIIQDGKCIARGEVVIVDDTFGVRIID